MTSLRLFKIQQLNSFELKVEPEMVFKRFSYDNYLAVVDKLSAGRRVRTFSEATGRSDFLVLRHDVDYSLDAALRLAELEKQNGIRSTYLVMCNSDYYNLADGQSLKKARLLAETAADVGLHFDLSACTDVKEAKKFFGLQLELAEFAAGKKVRVAAAHEPSHRSVAGFALPKKLIDCYSPGFSRKALYLSDSCQLFKAGDPLRLRAEARRPIQLLTHPIWWTREGKNWKQIIKEFFARRSNASKKRAEWLFTFYSNYHARHG